MKKIYLLLILSYSINIYGQDDALFIRKIYDEALVNGQSHENLRSLCKDIGARITGSAEAEMAIKWGEKLLNSYGFDKVYLQEIKVPHWARTVSDTSCGRWLTTTRPTPYFLPSLAMRSIDFRAPAYCESRSRVM